MPLKIHIQSPCQSGRKMRSDFIDMTGMKFGHWEVLAFEGKIKKAFRWTCRCECGKVKSCNGATLRNGGSTNCGCVGRQSQREKVSTHGMKKTKAYKIWSSMHERCKNWNKEHKQRYFERGISVCEKWNDFVEFWLDMGPSYQEGMTLERIDNDSGYSPDNCRWASPFEQARNRSTNRFYTMDGETLCIRDWEYKFNLPDRSLYKALNKTDDIKEAIELASK